MVSIGYIASYNLSIRSNWGHSKGLYIHISGFETTHIAVLQHLTIVLELKLHNVAHRTWLHICLWLKNQEWYSFFFSKCGPGVSPTVILIEIIGCRDVCKHRAFYVAFFLVVQTGHITASNKIATSIWVFWSSMIPSLWLFILCFRFHLVLRSLLLKNSTMLQFNCMFSQHWCLNEKGFRR